MTAGLTLGALQLQPASAAGKKVTEKDLKRVADGYRDLKYLMDNWNVVTRDCSNSFQGAETNLASGVLSPDACQANPDIVRKYMGMRSTGDKLFRTQQLWIDIENQDLVDSKDEDRFEDAVEEFEKRKRQASDWAYTSVWGENNPGGGRDKKEDYLLRAKKESAAATEALGVIVNVLKLE